MNNIYDYIIIGGGVSALAFANCANSSGKKCLIIDKNQELGGCHSTKRDVNGLAYFHSPLVYSNVYTTFMSLLQTMDLDFYELFTEYNFNFTTIAGMSITNISLMSQLHLAGAFLHLLINKDYGKQISMLEFMTSNKFSDTTIEYINSICKLTDGAEANTYSLNKFLQLVNQQALYKLYQPKERTSHLFKLWGDYLTKSGNIEFKLNTSIQSINLDINNKINSVVTSDNVKVMGKNYIFAIPPVNLLHILKASNINNVIDDTFAEQTDYIEYIPIAFHWKTKQVLPKIWGFPKNDWGLAFIVSSDYTDFKDPRSITVISSTLTKLDTKSNYTNKTANESTKGELVIEALRQLRNAFPMLTDPDNTVIEGIYRENTYDKWEQSGTAYIDNIYGKKIPFELSGISNGYQLGTQNGYSEYQFTSLESAVYNGIVLGYKLIPESQSSIKLSNGYTVIGILKMIIIILVLLLIVKNQ
jgi:protoporphyrinogen oxidase